MTKRVFYKYEFVVEVLSEDPINPNMSLTELEYSITNGDMSGFYGLRELMALNGLACANELMKQGSDPEFFQIDEDGNDILEEGDVVEVDNGDWVGVIVGFKNDTDGSTLVQVENQEDDVIDCNLSEVSLFYR